MSYLLDTNVMSAIGPSRADRPTALVGWLDCASDRLFLSVVTVAEVRNGIAKAEREGASRKAAALTAWWDAVEAGYADRILPFEFLAAHAAGASPSRQGGRPLARVR